VSHDDVNVIVEGNVFWDIDGVKLSVDGSWDVKVHPKVDWVVECCGLDVLGSSRPLLGCWIQKWTSSAAASRWD
jgi:hypothetical protein